MASNSLAELLLSMKGRSVCFGFGAVLLLSQTELNRLLAEQYLDGLNSFGFLKPLSTGELPVNVDQTETVELKSVVFGQPKLSFANSSLASPTLILTMNLVAGQYIGRRYPTLSAPMLDSSFTISEGMGFNVKFEVNLIQVYGNIDQRGRIMFDIAADPKPVCNLGESETIKAKIAARIQSDLAALPDNWRTFELGSLDLSGNNPLSPTDFYIRTMRAPDADTNPENGAVAVFIRTKAMDAARATPIEGSGLPYFIPDNQQTGKPLYSAALVLNQALVPLLTDTQLDVLKNLFFPGQNLFVEGANGADRHEPHDLLVLGNLKRAADGVSISPSFISLKAGSTQTFTARNSDGSAVSNVQWSVSCPDNPLAAGTISPSGVYQVPARSSAHVPQQTTVVTARFSRGGQEYEQSASVLAVFNSMEIKPRVCTRITRSTPQPVELAVSSLSGGPLVWPTLAPADGTLEIIDNNHALYTPPATISEYVELRKIVVTDSVSKEKVEAVVVLYRIAMTLPVMPFFKPTMVPSTPIQLEVEDYTPDELSWEILGEGTEDQIGKIEEGLFTPPSNPISAVSVVYCYDRHDGLSIIQHIEEEQEPVRWLTLDKFAITAPVQRTECFANGNQQIVLNIEIQTKSVVISPGVEVDIPVSDAELSTLKLIDKRTGAAIPFLSYGQEGIEHGSYQMAVSKKRNRFRLYSPTPTLAPLVAPSLPAPRNNLVRYRDLYLHIAVELTTTIYAEFQAADGSIWRSIDLNKENPEIEVTGIPHTPNKNNYTFKPTRVYQDPNGQDGPASPLYPDGDTFSYYLYSTDFWHLTYAREGRPVGFATLRIEENASTWQWESNQIGEFFASITGSAFTPATRPNVPSDPPSALTFDAYLWAMMRAVRPGMLDTSFHEAGAPSPGELRVSLHRLDDLPYWYDKMAEGDPLKMYRARLDPKVKFNLHDDEGNLHRVQVGFKAMTVTDSRNFLELTAI